MSTSFTRREFFKAGGLAAIALSATAYGVANARPRETSIRSTIRWRGGLSPEDTEPALHLLRRASFGPTRAELRRVRAMGVEAWIEEQLAPEAIDDSQLEDHINRRFETLSMTPVELRDLDDFPRILGEIQAATMERAVYSKRQLYQMMVDYWSNHFSVFMYNGPLRILKPVEDREVMRRYALSPFREILGADAKSPAMLVYLDNASSVAQAPNENYARELMELHTLGVDGGYTEQDVKEVARAFTGWSVDRRTGNFAFISRRHDREPKTVLGHSLPGGRGIEDGEEVLDILASHEATSRYVAHRLCVRFVADEPPEDVVNAAAATFRDTSGDIRAVLRVILTHQDFWDSAGQKIRRPFELLPAAVRTLEIPNARGMVLSRALRLLDQPLFGWSPPDGYPDNAPSWINTNALLARWNIGLALAEGKEPGVQIPWERFEEELGSNPSADDVLDFFIDLVLHQNIHPDDRTQLMAYLMGEDNAFDLSNPEHRRRVPELVALLLDSPYFQWR